MDSGVELGTLFNFTKALVRLGVVHAVQTGGISFVSELWALGRRWSPVGAVCCVRYL